MISTGMMAPAGTSVPSVYAEPPAEGEDVAEHRGEVAEQLLAEADRRMYRAKRSRYAGASTGSVELEAQTLLIQ